VDRNAVITFGGITVHKLATILALAVLAGSVRADDADKPWEIHGQVVDSQGKPVEDFEAASYWSSNGKQWDDAGERIKINGLAEMGNVWKEEGVLVASPKSTAKRLGNGKFSLQIEPRPRETVFAVDKQRIHGGFVSVERGASAKAVTIVLRPLVRVFGKIYCPDAQRTPDWTMAIVHPPGDRENYLHFTSCGSVRGKFSFLLPPGKYDLAIYSESPDARMPKPGERKVLDAPADMPAYLSGIRIDVPAQKELDLGVLNVNLPKDKNGVAHDYSLFYGKIPPELAITDVRGVNKNVKLADFRGKWVLLDFWALWCGPCVHDSLPSLTKFYEEHAADRKRFEILAICNTEEEKALTVEAFEPLAAPIVKEVWDGKQLPFPVLIDGEAKTAAVYGIQRWPTTLLIDPEGHLVKNGDEAMLADKLKKSP
jgi:thiol-disulfide isomerase/thioredoxin